MKILTNIETVILSIKLSAFEDDPIGRITLNASFLLLQDLQKNAQNFRKIQSFPKMFLGYNLDTSSSEILFVLNFDPSLKCSKRMEIFLRSNLLTVELDMYWRNVYGKKKTDATVHILSSVDVFNFNFPLVHITNIVKLQSQQAKSKEHSPYF